MRAALRELRRPPPLPEPAGRGPRLTATGVRVELGGRRVLDGVDLAVAGGEVVALVGPNGAGKSTLLGVCSGDVAVAAGDVVVDGRPLAAWSPRELAMRRATLTQHQTVSFPFTVAEVIAMGRAPWRGTERELEDDHRVAAAATAVEIDDLLRRRIGELSGGERARVALARVLAQATELLLLDEPTAALDLHHQELVLSLARAHAASGGAVVVVLHDLGLAAAHADRIVLLDGGRTAAVGRPDEVLRPAVLSPVYRHPIEVVPHPRTGELVVLPQRGGRPGGVAATSDRAPSASHDEGKRTSVR